MYSTKLASNIYRELLDHIIIKLSLDSHENRGQKNSNAHKDLKTLHYQRQGEKPLIHWKQSHAPAQYRHNDSSGDMSSSGTSLSDK